MSIEAPPRKRDGSYELGRFAVRAETLDLAIQEVVNDMGDAAKSAGCSQYGVEEIELGGNFEFAFDTVRVDVCNHKDRVEKLWIFHMLGRVA